jgi:hypothetical protein
MDTAIYLTFLIRVTQRPPSNAHLSEEESDQHPIVVCCRFLRIFCTAKKLITGKEIESDALSIWKQRRIGNNGNSDRVRS